MDKIEQALLKSQHFSLAQITSSTVTPLIDHMTQTDFFTCRQLNEKRIVHPSCKNQSELNYFRQLRANLAQDKTVKVILITAVIPRSGSSFIALNLSAVIALDHSRTSLLIDAHIDNPSNTHLLEVDKYHYGLTDYFDRKDLSVSNIIAQTGIIRLNFIPAGMDKQLGKEYFTGIQMKNLITELKERYRDRTIIIDAPCILTSADTRIIAEYCDAVLLISPYGKVSADTVADAANVVGKDKLAGVVLNKMY